jgi:membrane protein implicated in regulation of membrane protease activity
MAAIHIQAHHVWLALGLLLVVAEMLTGGFVLLWIGLGAAAASLIAYLAASFNAQLIGFGVASLLLFGSSRTIFGHVFTSKTTLPMNVDAMVGRIAVVIEVIGPGSTSGTVKVGGEVWSAVGTGRALQPGERTTIAAVEGLTLKVIALGDETHESTGNPTQ